MLARNLITNGREHGFNFLVKNPSAKMLWAVRSACCWDAAGGGRCLGAVLFACCLPMYITAIVVHKVGGKDASIGSDLSSPEGEG